MVAQFHSASLEGVDMFTRCESATEQMVGQSEVDNR